MSSVQSPKNFPKVPYDQVFESFYTMDPQLLVEYILAYYLMFIIID